MSDALFFLSLGLTLACATACTWLCRRFVRLPGEADGEALGIAVSGVVGYLAALPFERTREMPWWPDVVGGYFAICLITTALATLKRREHRPPAPPAPPAQRGFEVVNPRPSSVRPIDEEPSRRTPGES